MNFKRIASCFLAAAAICMTCSLSACRKEDGNVGDGANHATESRHTNNPIEDLMTDDHEDRKSTRLNSSHNRESRMPSSA